MDLHVCTGVKGVRCLTQQAYPATIRAVLAPIIGELTFLLMRTAPKIGVQPPWGDLVGLCVTPPS